MTTRRYEQGRVNYKISPHVEKVEQVIQRVQGASNAQVPIMEEANYVAVVPPDITNGEIRYALLTLTRVITTHVARDVEPRVNALDVTMTSRLGDFVI